jgi:hypothetical protein
MALVRPSLPVACWLCQFRIRHRHGRPDPTQGTCRWRLVRMDQAVSDALLSFSVACCQAALIPPGIFSCASAASMDSAPGQ